MPSRNDIPDTPPGKYLPHKRPEDNPARNAHPNAKVTHQSATTKHDPTRKAK